MLWKLFQSLPTTRDQELAADLVEEIYGEAFARYRGAVPALWPRLTAWRAPMEGPPPSWSLERYSENNELGTLLGLAAVVALFSLRAVWVAAGG